MRQPYVFLELADSGPGPPQAKTINDACMVSLRRYFRRNKNNIYVLASLISLVNFVFPQQVSAHASKAATAPVQRQLTVIAAAHASWPAPKLPTVPDVPVKRTVTVIATAYTSSVSECDSDPFTTASGAKTADGVIAANGFAFGTKVRIPDYFGDRVFTVLDRMGRGGNRIDIWMHTKHEAFSWGVRKVRMEIL